MNLAQSSLGQTVRVTALSLSADLAQRLAALGLRRHSTVTVLRRGWLGGPLQLRVGGTEIMLRRDAAQGITVQVLEAEISTAPELNTVSDCPAEVTV
jgi:ferrous iron transport protein A